MKTKKYNYSKIALLFSILIATTISCEREISDQAVLTTFPKDGTIFIDAFSGGLDYFPFGDSFQEAFSVDTKEFYLGSASMRFDIPVFGAGYGGANFPTSSPRDLSGYDALTFWAKASKGATINEIGFGLTESNNNKFRVTRRNLPITTQWRKYIIPIPDPSKLTKETGLFWYAEGAQNSTDEGGYIFWLDEVKFEKLGTIAQPRPSIFNGIETTTTTFNGSKIPLTGLLQTFNLGNGEDVTTTITSSYFIFSSSNPSVASVSETGIVTINTAGSAKITATLNGVNAIGSLTVNSLGNFPHAPIPTATTNVVSLFSDAYSNVPVRHYNGFFAPFQTTQGGAGSDSNNVDIQAPFANGGVDNIINYTALNFVSIGMYETVPNINVSATNTLHIDINVRENVDNGDFIRIQLESGTGSGTTSGGSFTINAAALRNANANGWISLNIPLSSFPGFNSRTNLGQLFFISDNTVKNIWVDNIYFYTN
jgi:hypothetical protein